MSISETMKRCYEARELPTWGDILSAADEIDRLTRQLAEAKEDAASANRCRTVVERELERTVRQLAEAQRDIEEWRRGSRLHVAAENVANERRREAERKLAEARAVLSKIAEPLLLENGYIDQTAAELSPEMRRLVIAARIVAFEGASQEAVAELGEASEVFAELVPWDDAPSTGSNQPDGETNGPR